MLNTHMEHLDWCEAVQDELKALRAELDAFRRRSGCKHSHLELTTNGWCCYFCGERANDIPGLRDVDLRGRS
jgi:hypothetical protein